ncbi:MAG: RNA methyltransferase [Elusimicrobia bacterium]|nr:RNA methyltransferase [Elusimicrobiota bacterium]
MDLRVVLVEPENPLNVGFVARAMRAFGVTDLVVASSAWKSLPAEARVTGVCAPDILDGIRFEKDLSGALRGCGTAIAFSRRPTALRQNEFTLPAVPASLSLKGRTALVFGRESAGLTRAESALCPHLARIPCENGVSLNLGQAVAVVLFSLTATDRELPEMAATASMDRMTALWDYVHPKLAASPRFTEERQRRIRQLFYRMNLDDTDYDVLFSVMKALAK